MILKILIEARSVLVSAKEPAGQACLGAIRWGFGP